METSEISPIEASQRQPAEKILTPGNKDKRIYEVEGGSVDVNFSILSPKEGDPTKEAKNQPDELILFFPGWSVDSDMKTAGVIGQAFADSGKKDVMIVDTKPKGKIENSLYYEAEAVSKLVRESGAKKITIAGYSEGGIKAINLAAIIQREHEQDNLGAQVEGLVLMESVGTYDQASKKRFVGEFLADTLVSSKYLIRQHTRQRAAQFGTDVIFGMEREAFRTGILGYPSRVLSQVGEMMNVEDALKDLKMPVVLIQGEQDPVSNPNKVIPGYKKLDDTTLGYGKGDNGELSKNLSHSLYDPMREDYLRVNIFPNSPFVRMLVGKNMSNHGIPVFRAEEIAEDSLYLLDRFARLEK